MKNQMRQFGKIENGSHQGESISIQLTSMSLNFCFVFELFSWGVDQNKFPIFLLGKHLMIRKHRLHHAVHLGMKNLEYNSPFVGHQPDRLLWMQMI